MGCEACRRLSAESLIESKRRVEGRLSGREDWGKRSVGSLEQAHNEANQRVYRSTAWKKGSYDSTKSHGASLFPQDVLAMWLLFDPRGVPAIYGLATWAYTSTPASD